MKFEQILSQKQLDHPEVEFNHIPQLQFPNPTSGSGYIERINDSGKR